MTVPSMARNTTMSGAHCSLFISVLSRYASEICFDIFVVNECFSHYIAIRSLFEISILLNLVFPRFFFSRFHPGLPVPSHKTAFPFTFLPSGASCFSFRFFFVRSLLLKRFHYFRSRWNNEI